jgi:hypothetical protein
MCLARLKLHPIAVFCALLWALFCPGPALAAGGRVVQGCEVVTLGHDLTHGNSGAISYSGKSLAQVFYAPDTLISSVTVWRPASQQGFGAGMHLYLCGVDSTLKPLPATDVLLNGPTLFLQVAGDAPAPVRYEFDPPFALPAVGHYAFAIKEEDPYCRNIIPLVTDTTMAYPDGRGWLIHKFADCHGLGSNAAILQYDLVFEIEYCQPIVSAPPRTWGWVRAQYR